MQFPGACGLLFVVPPSPAATPDALVESQPSGNLAGCSSKLPFCRSGTSLFARWRGGGGDRFLPFPCP